MYSIAVQYMHYVHTILRLALLNSLAVLSLHTAYSIYEYRRNTRNRGRKCGIITLENKILKDVCSDCPKTYLYLQLHFNH